MPTTERTTRPGSPVRLAATAFLPFAFGYFLSYLYRTVNAVIADDLAASVGLDAADLGLLTSAYFISFAAFQLPLGILLDRYGPRRVEAALLLVAAAGALLFSLSDGLAGLALARAVIGLGVSACLMAAFKNAVVWWPAHRVPLINGLVLASGGLGALAATTPTAALLTVVDWRGVFQLLAGLTVLCAGTMLLAAPDPPPSAIATGGLRVQMRGTVEVFASAAFWRLAPLTVAVQSTYMAYQGLWAGPWLRDVDGLGREAVAEGLQAIAIAMIAGYVLTGVLAERLRRVGVPPIALAGGFAAVFLANLAVLAFSDSVAPQLQWALFGFSATATILAYAILSEMFPPSQAGRVVTALNVLAFVGAFAVQWAIGAIVNAFATGPPGHFDPDGHRLAMQVMLGLGTVSFLWFLWSRPRAVADRTGC